MKAIAWWVQLILAAIFALIGAVLLTLIAPWAFVGQGPPEYSVVALCASPLVVTALLVFTAIITLRSSAPKYPPSDAENQS